MSGHRVARSRRSVTLAAAALILALVGPGAPVAADAAGAEPNPATTPGDWALARMDRADNAYQRQSSTD